jgi:hypothetical protein
VQAGAILDYLAKQHVTAKVQVSYTKTPLSGPTGGVIQYQDTGARHQHPSLAHNSTGELKTIHCPSTASLPSSVVTEVQALSLMPFATRVGMLAVIVSLVPPSCIPLHVAILKSRSSSWVRANCQDEDDSDDLKRRGLILGAHIPIGPSHLVVDQQVLDTFGEILKGRRPEKIRSMQHS